MTEKELFYNDENFVSADEGLKELIRWLVDLFDERGFEFDQQWRQTHSVRGKRVFVFKASNPINESKAPNVITVYPQAGWLKVEVYRGRDKKHKYDIKDKIPNEEMLEDAWSIYRLVAKYDRRKTIDVKPIEICDCPFSLGYIVKHTKYGSGKVVKIEDNGFYVEHKNGQLKNYQNKGCLNWFSKMDA